MQHSISHVELHEQRRRRLPATMVRPAAARGALPAVIVIHEAWGADAHIRDIADRIAAAGYLALVPDLYAHGGSRPAELAPDRIDALKRFTDTLPARRPGRSGRCARTALAQLPETEREPHRGVARGRALPASSAPDQFVADLRGAVAHLRDHPDCNGQIGALGFCMGGGLAGLLACDEPALRAAVVFYGTPPAGRARRRHRLPAARHLRRQGHRITDAVPAFAEAMEAPASASTTTSTRGAPHALLQRHPAAPIASAPPATPGRARSRFLVEHLG